MSTRMATRIATRIAAVLILLNEVIAVTGYLLSLTGSDCDPYNDLLTWFLLPVLAQLAHHVGNAVCY